MSEQSNTLKKSFKDTLNLPTTDFPIRPNHKEDDVAMLDRWKNEDMYNKTFHHNSGNTKFIFHDGPPYANGHLHIGHAYNKILKDIVTKSRRMLGNHVPVTPGWDCHGLPIEFAVTKENPELSGPALKKACREYAQKWIDIQKKEFTQLGVFMDWDHPYLTMNFSYEADTIRAFGILVEQRYIERKNKTVPWCPHCQTVLASAEIEYQDRKDPSLYVLFTLEDSLRTQLFPTLADKSVSLLVWTTTPWTLPLNRAVLLKPHTDYVVLDLSPLRQGSGLPAEVLTEAESKNYIIVGKQCADAIAQMLGVEKKIVAECNSDDFVQPGARVIHPFINGLAVPVLLDDSVLTSDGTACVHSAPGAGPIDYEVGIKNNLEIYSPITTNGHYTAEIMPAELVGISIADAQGWVIKKLLENNKLIFKTSIKHSYPHCWRCHGGLIFRATKQWFCDLSRNDLKEKAVDAIKNISMLPEGSYNRFEATVEGRLEWCLSRQRAWGVPIPAFICSTSDCTYIDAELIEIVATHVEKQGIEYWDTATLESIMPQGLTCKKCNGTSFIKETDILDVWFDSGISHYAVLQKNPDLGYPADMYLEGKDQHRGWFQSSLLTSMIIEKTPSMKTIVTHGYTVDAQGRKMSKSLGNVVSAQNVIDQMGTDGLRLWASSIDLASDPVVSEILLKNVQEVLRKIRNTCRFLLSNLYDFDHIQDAIPVKKMRIIDQYALQELFEFYTNVLNAYETYDFTRVSHLLGTYCSVNLSAMYLDIIKDRLYVEKNNGEPRRSAQTVCYAILDTLTKLMAPVLSFTAEQLSDHYQKNKTVSIHLQNFPKIIAFIGSQATQWNVLKDIRSALLKAIELEREKQLIKHSLEAKVTIYISSDALYAHDIHAFFNELQVMGQNAQDFFKEFLIVSQFIVASQQEGLEKTELKGLFARVEHAQGEKCPRCWQWDVNDNPDHLCKRCEMVLE